MFPLKNLARKGLSSMDPESNMVIQITVMSLHLREAEMGHKQDPLITPCPLSETVGLASGSDPYLNCYIMMSWYGNTFHSTGPLWGESSSNQWIPLTREFTMQSLDVSLLLTLIGCWTDSWIASDLNTLIPTDIIEMKNWYNHHSENIIVSKISKLTHLFCAWVGYTFHINDM